MQRIYIKIIKTIFILAIFSMSIFAETIGGSNYANVLSKINNTNSNDDKKTLDSNIDETSSLKEKHTTEKAILDLDEKTEEKISKIEREEFKEINKNIFETLYETATTKSENLKLFGSSFFDRRNSGFLMPTESSVGKNYVLSAGDTIKISVWGDSISNETTDKASQVPIIVNKNGTVFVPMIGNIFVNNKSLNEVEEELKNLIGKKYKEVKVEVTLLKMRDIAIYVLGEVQMPGAYILNPMSNIVNSIYSAGGISKNGSLRNVKIIRKDKTLTVDLYEYLLKGEKNPDISIVDGDTIFVPPIVDRVMITGMVVRAGTYEIKNETKISDVIKLAGGIMPNAFLENIKIKRISQDSMKLLDIKGIEESIKNGDIIEVREVKNTVENGVYILGNVVRPGMYEVKPGDRLNDILLRAGGVLPDTYYKRAQILRPKKEIQMEKIDFTIETDNPEVFPDDRVYILSNKDVGVSKNAMITGRVKNPGVFSIYKNTKISDLILMAKGLHVNNVYLKRADLIRIGNDSKIEVKRIDLGKALEGDKDNDVEVQNYDVLRVYAYDEIIIAPNIQIIGEVKYPKEITYYQNMTLEDIVFASKGFTTQADRKKIEVIRNNETTKKIDRIFVNYDENPNFVILESDQIYVRRAIGWEEKKSISISGEINVSGEYLISGGETINSIIEKAGGFKENAFPEGIKFRRRENISENLSGYNLDNNVLEALKNTQIGNTVLTNVANLNFNHTLHKYNEDIILKDGDEIYIPEKPLTVKIIGEVFTPGMISYKREMNLSQYLDAAGGFKEKALIDSVYVIKYNGKTEKPGFWSSPKIEAGDTIVVPRREKDPDNWMKVLTDSLQLVANILLTYKLAGEIVR